MWVEFLAPFRWKPTPRSAIRYVAGTRQSVKRECGEAAIAAGAARPIKTPSRNEAKGE